MRFRSLRSLLLPAALLFVGCPSRDGGKSGPCDPDRVRYEGRATDETCITLVDAEEAGAVALGGPDAPVLLSPTNGGAVAASSSSLTLTWDTPLDLDLTRAPRRMPLGARHASLASAVSALWPVSTAWAHEAPVTGAIHRLRLRGLRGSDEAVDIMTSTMAYTLDAELLEDLHATDGPVTIELVSMYVTQNLINNASTDGPFQMDPLASVDVQ